MRLIRATLLAAATLACAHAAEAALFVGYLGDCSASTTTSCTELTATAYARQPIMFNAPAFGKAVSSMPYYFASTVTGTVVARALYDAPTGGNLLVVMPLATALSLSSPGDRGDVGSLTLTVTSIAAAWNGTFSQAAIASGAAVGTTQDGSTATAGSALTITRGELYKAGTITW